MNLGILSCPRCAAPLDEQRSSDALGRMLVERRCACGLRECFAIDFANSRESASEARKGISSLDLRPSIGSVAAFFGARILN
jgi:hypothetical protein